jgi:hypothetical protein
MKLQYLALTAAWAVSGCATVVPQFDLPRNEAGPTVNSVRREVECELDEIVKNDKGLDSFLAGAHDIDVSILLNLDVTDDGALAPTYSYTSGLFSFAGGFSFEQSRDQNFQQVLNYSLAERQALNKDFPGSRVCGQSPDTNLSGDLGLKNSWDLALTGLTYTDWKATGANGGPFGGTVSFTVKKQVTATGPTWTLKYYKGPGSFLTAYETNVDKLTFAFVEGPKAKDKGAVARAANEFLQTIQQGNISNSLTTIQNKN